MKGRASVSSIIPAVLIYLLGFIAPLLMMAYISLKQYSPLTGISNVLSLANYRKIVGDPIYLEAFANTLLLCLTVVVITAALAYPVCIYISSVTGTIRTILLIGVIAPLMVSVVVRTFGWQILMGPNGLIEKLTGIKLLYTNTAVIIGLVHLFLAHMVLAILAVMSNIPADLINAARTLGASSWRIFWRIILPLTIPGLISGAVITFGASSGALITPMFLGGGRVSFASHEIYRETLVFFNWPMASALSIGLLIMNYALINVVEWALGRQIRGKTV